MRLSNQRPALLALALAASISSCATTNQSVGLRQVDDLVGSVELVHLEAELSRQQLFDTLGNLRILVAPDFSGDPLEAYGTFALSVISLEEQAAALRASRAPMESAASTVFGQWEHTLDSFSGETMRKRSARRLAAARERYEEVRFTAERAQAEIDAFHATMSDMALFLEHDFNPSSVADILSDAPDVASQAQELRGTLEECMTAAEEYVRAAAPLGEVVVTPMESPAEPRKRSAAKD